MTCFLPNSWCSGRADSALLASPRHSRRATERPRSGEIWKAKDQQWYYEEAKGHIDARAVECHDCRAAKKRAKSREDDHAAYPANCSKPGDGVSISCCASRTPGRGPALLNWCTFMTLFWSARNIPELATLSETDFRAAYEACVTPIWKSRISVAVLVCVPCMVGGQLIGTFAGSAHWWPSVLGAGLGGLVGAQIYIQIVFSAARPHIRKYLAGQKHV